MKFLRAVAFALCFSIDVTVRAAMPGILRSPVEEPKNCLRRAEICAIGTYKGTKYELVVGSAHLILGQQTSLTRLERSRYILLSGELWVRTEDEIIVESEYGEVSVYHGEALLSRTDRQLVVKSLNGQVKIHPKGGKDLEVERGFENALYPVGKLGHAQTSIPQLIDLNATIKELGDLYIGDKRDFSEVIESIFDNWPETVNKASEFHSELAKRAIASDNIRVEKEMRRRQAIEAERRRLNELFRSKTLDY